MLFTIRQSTVIISSLRAELIDKRMRPPYLQGVACRLRHLRPPLLNLQHARRLVLGGEGAVMERACHGWVLRRRLCLYVLNE